MKALTKTWIYLMAAGLWVRGSGPEWAETASIMALGSAVFFMLDFYQGEKEGR